MNADNKILQALDGLRVDIKGLKQGQEGLEAGQRALAAGQKALQDTVQKQGEQIAALQDDVTVMGVCSGYV